MKHAKWLVLALLVVVAFPAAAGEYHKCDMDTQGCLDKMAAKVGERGWVGIEMDSGDEGALMITRVVPGSPAEASGLEVDDVLLAVNGAKFADNSEDKCVTCDAMKDDWKPGSEVHYVVARNGKKLKVDLTLGQIPSDVMAQWVGQHMLQHTTVEIAQN
jgi:C-terminal processing protease CtpA/Prc